MGDRGVGCRDYVRKFWDSVGVKRRHRRPRRRKTGGVQRGRLAGRPWAAVDNFALQRSTPARGLALLSH
jgi:hypothetical protein